MRKLIPAILARDTSIEVVGTAMDGAFALKKIEELQPDVVTLDLDMPRMDGMETLRPSCGARRCRSFSLARIQKRAHTPRSRLSRLAPSIFLPSRKMLLPAISTKLPTSSIAKIKVAKRAAGRKALPKAIIEKQSPRRKKDARTCISSHRIIAIGISTGGPNALQFVLSQSPADFPSTIIMVQHMPEGFTEMFAKRLDECCALEVQEARSGDLLLAGRVLICPGNRHIMVRRMPRGDMVVLSDGPPVNGHRPSADVLFHSVAQEFGLAAVGILMTGMGDDGAEGLGAIKAAGGMTIAQSEDTCVVSGMPRAAILKGYANKIIPLDGLSSYLVSNYGAERNSSEKLDKNDKHEKNERTPVSSSRS